MYQIIQSHARLVGACTKLTTSRSQYPTLLNPNLNQLDDEQHGFSSIETQATQTTRRSHGSSNNSECNLKGLERRYHSLYLRAYEVKLLLEKLLEREDLQVCKCICALTST